MISKLNKMEEKENKLKIYYSLIHDIDKMIEDHERGYDVTQKLNEEFWEGLDSHKERMEEQVSNVKEMKNDHLENEIQKANSIYEATRLYIRKYNE
jgi:hypothetical protein